MNPTSPNILLNLNGVPRGIASFAAVLGLRNQDLFNIAAAIFLMLIGAAVALFVTLLLFDAIIYYCSARRPAGVAATRRTKRHGTSGGSTRPLKHSNGAAESSIGNGGSDVEYDAAADGYTDSVLTSNRGLSPKPPAVNSWYKEDDDLEESYTGVSIKRHLCLLQGNCTRLLILFHLPLSVFSTYQISLYKDGASTPSFALAVLMLAIVCVAIPAFLVWHVHRQEQEVLESDIPTILVRALNSNCNNC